MFIALMLNLQEFPKTRQILLGHGKIATTLGSYRHELLEFEAQAGAWLDAALRVKEVVCAEE